MRRGREEVEGDVHDVTLLDGDTMDAWAIVTMRRDMAGCRVRWLAGARDIDEDDAYLAGSMRCDMYRVAEPDEWPDEICAAVALYQMGIE